MISIKKILFPTDFSRCADQALTHALHLAEQYDAELHMLHVVVLHEYDPYNPVHQFPKAEELEARLNEIASREMDAVLENRNRNGVDATQAQIRDIAAAPAIIQYAHDHDIDVIVMGTHGRRGLKHLLLGSVAEEVVRTAYRPVLTIREEKVEKRVEAVERILVPIDFSKYAREALIYAKELASTYDAELQLLHIVEETMHPAFYNTGVSTIYDVVPDLEAKAKQALSRLLAETPGTAKKAEVFVRKGRAVRDIVRFAENNDTDLIVIATHGLTGIEHLLIGSVTEKVVRLAPCPVFTVKPFGKSLITPYGEVSESGNVVA